MGNSMKVFYNDGEVDVYGGIEFQTHDLESLAAPNLLSLAFEHEGKQICIFLNTVKKIEITVNDEE